MGIEEFNAMPAAEAAALLRSCADAGGCELREIALLRLEDLFA